MNSHSLSILKGRPSGVIKYSRWLLVLTTLFISFLLTGSGLRGIFRANRVGREIIQTRAKDILAGVKRAITTNGIPSQEVVNEIVQDMEKQGVTYISGTRLNQNQTDTFLSAGTNVLDLPGFVKLKSIKKRELVIALEKERAQIIEKLIPGRRQFRRQLPRQHEMFLVIEFKPTMALTIIAESRTILFLGILATILFILANVLLWKLSLREEKLATKLASEAQLARLGEMSAILGHEIRNPLASLKGHGQLLARKLKGDDRLAKAELIVKEARRIEELTGQILDFAKSGTITCTSTPVEEMITTVCERFTSERLIIDAENCPESWSIDRGRMEQVLTNIIRNGLQACAPSGKVSIHAFQQKNALHVTIRDDGPGIKDSEKESIFEPFRTNSLQGTGLGLTVAKRIVEGHNGTITAGNNTGGGAFFHIIIP